MKFIITLAFLFFIKLSEANLYDENDTVTEITKENFDKLVIGSDNVWMVHFYTTWCNASVEMSPEIQKAASALKGAVKVGAVDADKHRIIAKRYDITQVPQVMIFSGIYSFPYFEQRTATAMSEAALSELYNKVMEQLKEATAADKL